MNLSLKTIKPTIKRTAKIIKSISFNLLSFSARVVENNVLSHSNVTEPFWGTSLIIQITLSKSVIIRLFKDVPSRPCLGA